MTVEKYRVTTIYDHVDITKRIVSDMNEFNEAVEKLIDDGFGITHISISEGEVFVEGKKYVLGRRDGGKSSYGENTTDEKS